MSAGGTREHGPNTIIVDDPTEHDLARTVHAIPPTRSDQPTLAQASISAWSAIPAPGRSRATTNAAAVGLAGFAHGLRRVPSVVALFGPGDVVVPRHHHQREALCRFLDDGRLPLHNNISERALRREAVGRKNWIFLGSDEGGRVNTLFVSLLASCQMHGIEPQGYLRDLFCLLPSWPRRRVLELAPVYWTETLKQEDAQQRLAALIAPHFLAAASLEPTASQT